MSTYVELSPLDVVLSFGLVAVAFTVSLRHSLGLERSLLWATFRTLLQLAVVGYLIRFIFDSRNPILILVLLLIMLLIAGWTATLRQPMKRLPLYPLTLISLALGAGLTLVIVIFMVVRVEPWYDPRYLIPLGGIILGNSMNAVALGLERLERELREGRKCGPRSYPS
jgi:putative ABC transport system permease protein